MGKPYGLGYSKSTVSTLCAGHTRRSYYPLTGGLEIDHRTIGENRAVSRDSWIIIERRHCMKGQRVLCSGIRINDIGFKRYQLTPNGARVCRTALSSECM